MPRMIILTEAELRKIIWLNLDAVRPALKTLLVGAHRNASSGHAAYFAPRIFPNMAATLMSKPPMCRALIVLQ